MTDLNILTVMSAASGPGRPKAASAICRSEEPEFGRPDPELMQAGNDQAKLARLKVETKFSTGDDLAVLDDYVRTLAEAPESSVLTDEVVPKNELFRKHPDLAVIEKLDARYKKNCRHYQFFNFFRSDEYWNNAVVLLSVLGQKNIERDSKEGIRQAIDYCQRFRARIEAQKCADKKFAPVEYYAAVLDLTEAELRAQVRKQPRQYYAEAQAMARRSLTVLSNLKDKYYWPSEPDYFTISKGLLILGDLNLKVKDFNRREIAALRRKPGTAAAINRLETENDRLLRDAHLAYGALAGVRQGLTLKLSDMQFNFSQQSVEQALQSNVAKGFINTQEAGEAYKAIFRYLQSVAALKKNSLLPQLRRVVKEDEITAAMIETDQALGELKSLLSELKAETAAEHDPARKVLLQNRLEKMQSGFYLHFGGLVRADLSLALLDRMNFAVINRGRSEWNTFLNTIKEAKPLLADSRQIAGEIDKLAAGMAAALTVRDLPDGRLEKLRNDFTELVTKKVARGRYDRIRSALLSGPGASSFRLKYLYGWNSVKQIEIAVRAAEYVKYSGSRKDIGQANRYIQECEQLKVRWIAGPSGGHTVLKNPGDPRWAEADSYFEADEYLGIELDYLESIFYAYRFDPKAGGTANSPAMIDSLSDRVKANANYLPEEQLSYFSLYSGLKNGIAQIQRQKFEAAANLLERIKAQVEGNGHASSIAGYLEPLAWDEHTLKAELYHQLAVAYSWIEKDKPASAANLTGIYAVRAYKECSLSTSIYDKILRPKALASDLKLGPDGRKIKSGAGAGPDEEIEVIR